MATIDNLSLNITAQATDATKKIRGLSEALNSLKSSAGVNSAVKNLTNLKEAITSLNRIRFNADKIKTISSGIRSINNSISGISMSNVHRVERLANALEKLGATPATAFRRASKSAQDVSPKIGEEPKESAKDAKESAEAMGETADNASKLKKEIDKSKESTSNFKERVKSLAESLRKIGAVSLKALWKSISSIGNVFKKITDPFKNLVRALGRIALYRLLRSIIKEITSGIKEGVENLARFSKLMNEMDTHKANRVMSLYASNFLYLKNTIATAVIPILKALEPVVDMVINRIIDLTNVIAQLFSAFTGASTFTRAKYYFIDYADSLDKASGSAGKLNKQLAQFDELNNLTTSSGSGSGTDLDYLKMFEDPVPIADWIKKLKEFIDKGDWYSVGQTLSLKLRDSLRSIDWDEVGNKATEKGKGLAGFFNGLIRPDTAYEIGKALVGVVTAGLRYFNAFSSEMDWKNVGASFASFLNGIIENAKPEELADAINNMVKAFLDFAVGFFTEFDWISALDKMFGTLKNLDVETYAVIAGGFLLKVFSMAGTQSATTFGETLASAIVAGMGGYLIGNGLGQIWAYITGNDELLEEYQNANPFSADTELGNKTYDFWEEVFDFWKLPSKKDILQGRMGGLTVDVFKLTHGDMYKAKQDIINSYHELGLTTEDAIKDFNNYVKTGELPSFLSDETKATIEEYKKYAEFIDETAYIDAFTEIGKELDALNGKVEKSTDKSLGFWDKLKAKANEVGTSIYGTNGFWDKVWNKASEIWTTISTGFWDKLKEKADTVGNSVYGSNGFWAKVKAKADEIITALCGSNGFWSKFGLSADQIWTKIKSGWDSLKAKIMNDPINASIIITQTIKTITSGAQSVISAGNQIYENALNQIPATTTISPTNTSSKIRVKNPHYANSSAQRAWELAHPKDKYEWYAHGGFPDMGSMFIAGEAGAELVGNINGRTGVANTDQIEDAIYQASYDAMSKALSENNMSVIVEGDTDGMFRAFQRKANDFRTRTGRPAI